MHQTVLPGTALRVSRFVFGTGSLHRLGGRSAQVEMLEAAASGGFTHFDTAPLYGFGAAERAIGNVFSSEPTITVTTKVGLYPPGGADQYGFSMLIRKAGGKLLPSLSRAVANMSVARARYSLEGSLRRLRRTRIDLLMLHDPFLDFLPTDEWLRWLESETDRVQYFGVSGPASRVAPLLKLGGPLAQVIQVRDGLETHEADIVTAAGRPLQLTYGYFTSNTSRRSGKQILAGALKRNCTGGILVTTSSRARLLEFADAAAQDSQC